MTIDPARRLADALGIGALSNAPKRIEGDWPGELSAVMLDAKGTFDELVARYSADEEQAERILSNRLYRNLTSALSGTQEYMAAEKLYELNESAAFDLVVVDTPPTRNALDFLDAPGRLTRFLENRIFQLLLMPTRASLRALTVATQALLKTISKVAGAEIVEDAVAFFRAFDGMEGGFRDRAKRVEQLLSDAGTSFVLVAAPRRDSVEEAGYFADRLAEAGQVVSALVMNRLHPDFRARAGHRGGTARRRRREDVDGLSREEAEKVLAGAAAEPRRLPVSRRPGAPVPDRARVEDRRGDREGAIPRAGRARPRRARHRGRSLMGESASPPAAAPQGHGRNEADGESR